MKGLYYVLFPEVTTKLHKNFIETGYVPRPTLDLIARKLSKFIKLNDMELDIFYAKTSEINEIIKSIKP